MGDLEFLFVLLFAALLFVRTADSAGIPYPIVLVLGGLGLAFVPHVPEVRMDSHAVLLVFAPPLLLSAGWYSSPRELRAESHALAGLAFTLVLATMVAVAVAAHALVDGLSWPLAFTLGAVVAPTDAVAATATFKRVQVPERVKLLVSGESLINDATGLTAFKVALAGVGASFRPEHALLDFVVATLGGAAVGIAVGWLMLYAIRKSPEVEISIVLTILSAYASYIAAEQLGASGILASAVCGVYAGWRQSEFFDADTRLNAVAFWDTMIFGLETLLFVLLGLQLKRLPDTLGHLALAGLALSAVVVLVRLLFVYLPPSGGLSRRERIVVGWCGMRGAISFAAALSIGSKDPESTVLVLTFIVILVTLVGQGLTLPTLIRALKLNDGRSWSPEEAIARLETAQAALDRLDELESEGRVDDEPLRRMRDLYRARFRQCMAILGNEPSDAIDEVREERLRYRDLRRELINTERATLLGLRNDGRARQQTLRLVERDLDLDEARLR